MSTLTSKVEIVKVRRGRKPKPHDELPTRIIRFQVDFNEIEYEKLEKLLRKSGFKRKKDLINTSLALYQTVLDEQGQGAQCGFMDKQNIFHKLILAW